MNDPQLIQGIASILKIASIALVALACVAGAFAAGCAWRRWNKGIYVRALVQVALGGGVFALAVFGASFLLMHPHQAKRTSIRPRPPLVDAVVAKASPQRIEVTAMGTVQPAVQIDLQAQVSGRIIGQRPSLLPGGRFKEGEDILKIDPSDYQFAVEQRKADVERARYELKVELGRQTIAKEEWTLLDSETPTTPEGRDLALRVPHLQNAEAALAAAKSSLDKAMLDLQRTTLRAPFNALVLNEAVDLGQVVSPQTRLLTLVGTDAFYVQVVVPTDRLDWIRVPGLNGTEGSRATVFFSTGSGSDVQRHGHVIRLLGDLSPGGRMAQLLVQVDDPLGLNDPGGAGTRPLLLGSYVRVVIEGPQIDNVFALPRKAIREGDRVWIVGRDDQLEVRPVQIIWGTEQTVLITDAVHEGDRIITSRIDTPLPGMKLRVAGEPEVLNLQPLQRWLPWLN